MDFQVNVRSRRCAAPNCTRMPLYNSIGNKEEIVGHGLFCAQHKEPGMVSHSSQAYAE